MAGVFTYNNQFVKHLPADPSSENQPRQVPTASFSRVFPTPVSNPTLIAYSEQVASLLGLPYSYIQSDEFLQVMSGNLVLEGMEPFAMNYAGHQFGNWAGQLGDGRAINLAEVNAPDQSIWTLQLKGAGPTPYSRTADGRAVLRSSIREFLCSEAMFHLGVPTTRALSLVLTGDSIVRDMFYDGNAALEPGAIVCRVAPSFIRFGNFQVHAARQEHEILSDLLDHCIALHFNDLHPSIEIKGYDELKSQSLQAKRDLYIAWYEEVLNRTIDLVVHWMRVGFVHGVLNTDNMSILGLTIDYGPYGWVDNYDLNWTPNTTDTYSQRYIFGNQPAVVHWNLAQLARAIVPLVGDSAELERILSGFPDKYQLKYHQMMAKKLGFRVFEPETDLGIFQNLVALFDQFEVDMTLFFRQLALLNPDSIHSQRTKTLEMAFYSGFEAANGDLTRWIDTWGRRLQQDPKWTWAEAQTQMNAVNPKYVLRNYMAQEAIEKAHLGDYSLLNQLLTVLKNPYDEQPEAIRFYAKRPDWAREKAGSSRLSCSS